MAVVHSFAFGEEPEDLENKSRASCYDDKTAFVQANGTPENKVCNDKCCRTIMCYCYLDNRATKTIQVVIYTTYYLMWHYYCCL